MEACVPRDECSAGVGGDVAARVEYGVGVCFFRVEEVFASKDEVAAAVVPVLLEMSLCGADVRRVNGDEVGGNVLTFEQAASVPIIEANGVVVVPMLRWGFLISFQISVELRVMVLLPCVVGWVVLVFPV